MKVPRSALLAPFLLTLLSTTSGAQQLGLEFDLFEKVQRINIVRELCHSMTVSYAFWNLKAERTGVSPERICADAIAREAATPNPPANAMAQARANLAFLDRMQHFQAAFRDSHFYLAPAGGRTRIRMPFKVDQIGGRITVTSVEPFLLARLTSDAKVTGIEVGDELLTVGGEPAATALTKLLPYIPNSSRLGARNHAASALTDRSFRFPLAPTLKFTMKKLGTGEIFAGELPWVYDGVLRADEKFFLAHAGYHAPVAGWKTTWDPKTHANVRIKNWSHGYDEDSLVGKLKQQDFLFTPQGPAVISGIYDGGGVQAAVLQIRSFPARVLGKTTTSRSGDDFAESAARLVDDLLQSNLPLIVDLRHNDGGVMEEAAGLASLLIPKGKAIGGPTLAMPVTHFNRQLREIIAELESRTKAAPGFSLLIPQGIAPELSEADQAKLLRAAAAAKNPFSSAYVTADVEGEADPNALKRGVATLISPDCVSACEVLASLLKSAGASVFVGTETDGTGGGYIIGGPIDGSWKDDYSSFRAMFPTFLFGRPGETAGKREYPGEAMSRCSEQRPTRADPGLEYQSDLLADVLGGDSGWMRKAVEALAARPINP